MKKKVVQTSHFVCYCNSFMQILKQRDHEHQDRVAKLSSAHLSQESRCLQLDRQLTRAQSSTTKLQKEMAERLAEAEEQVREQSLTERRLHAELLAMEDKTRELEKDKEKCLHELHRKQDDFLRK